MRVRVIILVAVAGVLCLLLAALPWSARYTRDWIDQYQMSLSPDARTLAILTPAGTALYDLESGEVTALGRYPLQAPPPPEDPRMVDASSRGMVRAWLGDGFGGWTFSGADRPRNLDYQIRRTNTSLQIVQRPGGSLVVQQPVPYDRRSPVSAPVAFTPDGDEARVATKFGTVSCWDLTFGAEVRRITGLGPPLWPASWTVLIAAGVLWLAAWVVLGRPAPPSGATGAPLLARPGASDWILIGADVLLIAGLAVVIKLIWLAADPVSPRWAIPARDTAMAALWFPVAALAAAAPVLMFWSALASRARLARWFAVLVGLPSAVYPSIVIVSPLFWWLFPQSSE